MLSSSSCPQHNLRNLSGRQVNNARYKGADVIEPLQDELF